MPKLARNVPQSERDGEYVFGVSALEKHLSRARWSEAVIDEYRDRLERDGSIVKQGPIQVPDDWELDHELLRSLLRARVAELREVA